MKVLSYETLKARVMNAGKVERERSEKIKLEETTLAQLRAEQEEAAKNGDYDLYEAKGEEIKKTQNKIVVLMKTRNPAEVTPEDVLAAWLDFAGKEEKDLASDYAAYEKKRKDAANDYEKMLKKANTILQRRNEFAGFCGMDTTTEEGRKQVESFFQIGELIPYKFDPYFPQHFAFIPEYAYFGRAGLWGKDASNILNSIVRNHVPVDSVNLK